MALWTLFGLASGKATTDWPRQGHNDGQEGVFGMPRYHADACSEGCEECANVCPTHAIEAHDRGARSRLWTLHRLQSVHGSMPDRRNGAV